MTYNSRVKDGGYTTKTSPFQNTTEISSLEHAITLGFTIIKAEKK